ncbi:hypothetical protein VIGAN_09018400 [Vigna angularis var. angularis]|uniref:BHLH domain-containing protein n=1 Tax=Vigna angularis var. angularis TaxID=157739 RepID=A0A0S3SVH5_PHAAN|nr:hypothetical protein VIGAN_09018400 [Vigna angularis var. angularis]
MDDDELRLFNEHDVNSLEEELMKGESSVPYDSDFAINNNNNMENLSCLETNTNSSSEKNHEFSSCTLSFENSTVVSNDADEAFHAKQKKSTFQTQLHIMSERKRKRREKISTMREMGDDEFHLFVEHEMNSLEEELMKGESGSGFGINKNNNNMGDGSCLKKNTQRANSGSEKQTEQHIMAERKRREKISTMMIELSTMLPGLKKLDKISIVGKTIDYVKHLENRVNDLQEQKRKTESVKCCKNKGSNVNISEKFPKVDASVSVCSSVLPLGSSALNISIICQVEHFSMAVDDLVNILNEDLLKLYNLQ